MEIIGFIACVVILIYVTFVWFFCAPFTMGKWNMGGVPNTWTDRLMMLVFLAVIAMGWYMAFANAPFTIVVTKV
jgi:uncharacterized membrane protein